MEVSLAVVTDFLPVNQLGTDDRYLRYRGYACDNSFHKGEKVDFDADQANIFRQLAARLLSGHRRWKFEGSGQR